MPEPVSPNRSFRVFDDTPAIRELRNTRTRPGPFRTSNRNLDEIAHFIERTRPEYNSLYAPTYIFSRIDRYYRHVITTECIYTKTRITEPHAYRELQVCKLQDSLDHLVGATPPYRAFEDTLWTVEPVLPCTVQCSSYSYHRTRRIDAPPLMPNVVLAIWYVVSGLCASVCVPTT